MKIEKGMIRAANGKFVHRIGDSAYFESAYILKGDTLANFEEVDKIPTPSDINYDEEVNRLIRNRYSLAQELAILRQRDTKPEEFAEYNTFAEACKVKAKEGVK